ncbi:MAG TPA: type II secretion system protein N, partial [Candidatus Brocadiia bacterium]|nr:type II secretion system protein N [Candidatus Brocadiia bacterium]
MRKVVWVLNLVLVGLLGFLAADLRDGSARPAPGVEGASAPQKKPGLFSASGRVSVQDAASIIRRNVFGVKPSGSAKPPPQELAAGGAPEAKPAPLRLRLVGTIAGPPDFARAVIEDLSLKTQDMYRIGAVIQGAAIVGIERNRVVLNVGGRKETLEVSLTADAGPPPVAGPGQEKARAALEHMGEAVRPAGDGRFAVDRSKQARWAEAVASLMKTVKLEPYT